MSTKIRILPYKLGSKSSKILATTLGALRIRTNRNTYRYRQSHQLINWGYSGGLITQGLPATTSIINSPEAVRIASSKLRTLQCLTEQCVPTLDWTTRSTEAQQWLDDMEASNIYCRHLLSSNSGKGIEVVEFGGKVPEDCPLYTKGLHKWTEWRFHVGRKSTGIELIALQQKIKRGTGGSSGTDNVRNHGNDYIFKRYGLSCPEYEDGLRVAGEALSAIGLDFAGIDMAHTSEGWKVIEVNTAPGLTGSTITDYVNYFKERLLS